MEKGFWEDVDPFTSISSSDTIEFLCAANSGVYTDLASSYLYVKAKITTAAGGNVGGGKVGLGLKQRHAYTRESKSVAMEGRIHSDLFAQDSYILGAVPIKIKLVRSRVPFFLV